MAQRVGFTHAGINFESQYQIENPPAGDREILYSAQRVGFEPTCGCPQTDFESFMQL